MWGALALGSVMTACRGANEVRSELPQDASATPDVARMDAAAFADEAGDAGEPDARASTPDSAGSPGDDAASQQGPALTRAPDAGAANRMRFADAGWSGSDASAAPGFDWELPAGFPRPVIPADNPMSAAKVALGRRLFYDKRLSGNQTQSCASCHQQALAFTDGRATGLGSTGMAHPRGAPALINLAYATSLTWANPLFAIGVLSEPLERQTQIPIYGDSPVEMGMKSQSELVMRLQQVALYRDMFRRAFPDQAEPLTAQSAGRALAAFERILISGDSRYDRFMRGDDSALTDSERRGLSLFKSDRLECASCHEGFALSEHVSWEGKGSIELVYRNTGLYNIDGMGAYPSPNTGAFNVTMDPNDMGKFRVPTLRNIAVTAPYMHDGSVATLSEVIDHYAAGGRTILEGPYAGSGKDNPLKDPRIHGFAISEHERSDLITFLESLTDEAFLTNPAFGDPWVDD